MEAELVDLEVQGLQVPTVDVAHHAVKWCNFLKEFLIVQLRQVSQSPFDVHRRSQEELELLRLIQIGAANHLLEEHVEVEATFFDEVLVCSAHCTFGRHRWDVESWESGKHDLSEYVEFLVSSLDLEATLRVFTVDSVHDEVALRGLLRVADAEPLSKLIGSKGLVDGKLTPVALKISVIDQFGELLLFTTALRLGRRMLSFLDPRAMRMSLTKIALLRLDLTRTLVLMLMGLFSHELRTEGVPGSRLLPLEKHVILVVLIPELGFLVLRHVVGQSDIGQICSLISRTNTIS